MSELGQRLQRLMEHARRVEFERDELRYAINIAVGALERERERGVYTREGRRFAVAVLTAAMSLSNAALLEQVLLQAGVAREDGHGQDG